MPKSGKLSCSYQTQKKIAEYMKELMKKKSFDKISISDKTSNCSIHRQTFYYHFNDKYELLEWIIYNELVEPLINGFTLDNMYERFEIMFSTMKRDEMFFKSAFKVSHEWFALYLNNTITKEFSKIVVSINDENGTTFESQKDILITSQFISYGITGVVYNWAMNGMKETPQNLTESLKNIVSGVKRLANRTNN